MKRMLYEELLKWKRNKDRKSLISKNNRSLRAILPSCPHSTFPFYVMSYIDNQLFIYYIPLFGTL